MKSNEKLSPEKIQKILDDGKASMAIEGFEVTEKEEELVRQYLEGALSEEEVIKRIKGGL
ncbi:antitoxin VbhA family protein [Desulfitobacterium chlororespirans]|uniref:Antitoxin VbhA domain-containing protein n=1 Tax=Desulfitobacterium chlororespirans DSM 11544 TaxID=1121395 RepID=A0A1M7UYD3_9FIRM|nr:antitoxin VbhA family protein [Desulfitobacterium chlororespirans]SHN87978.1 hypothetical protein SAMN02745215_05062 [Desulfitobacterium chlororespirans DSM 11544]